MKVKENELKNILKIFNNKDVIIDMIQDFKVKLKLDKVNINFNNNTGFMYIGEYTKKNIIKINITTVQYIELKGSTLEIQLDDSNIIIKITKDEN